MIFPDFAELHLELDPLNGGLLYSATALGEICYANALDPAPILGDEDLACSMIAAWYLAHREAGGSPDSIAEMVVSRLTHAESVH